MQINVTFDQITANLPAGFVSAVNYVVNYFDNLFTNNATININVGYGEVGGSALGSNALGSSITNYFGANYNTIKSALVAENAPGASTLPSSSPLAGSPVLAQAEAKALGLTSTTSTDGNVGFSNTVSWDYTTAAPSAGQYYLIGTIEHEITEVMGRQSLINYAPNFYTVMDLYRYSAPGVRSTAAGGSGSTAYFSVDNGVTNLGTWNNNASNGDLGDWYPSGPAPGGRDALNDYSSSGVINIFSASDITNMEAIGWTVANGAAAPTIASFSPDSGTVGDGITNATVLILAGTATASSTVNVYDGATLLGTAVADANGAWSFTTGTLSNGSHSFTATDTVSGTTSAAVTATVDTTAPGETISSTIGTNTGSTSTITSGGLTHDNTLALSGTVSDANGVSSVQIYDGATLLGTATVSNGTWSFTTAGLVDGNHSFTAKATDAAGNTTTTAAVTATVDTTAPGETISSTIGTNTGSASTITSGGLTNDNTLALSGTVSDANGVTSVQIYDGATLLGTATVSAGTWSFTTAGLVDGNHSFTAKATDAAGNTTTTAAVTATVDTTASTGGTPDLVAASDSGSSNSDNITGITSPTFTVALNSTVAAGDVVELLLSGASFTHAVTHTITSADITAGSVSLAVTAGDLGADGSKSISAKFTDASSNTSTTAALAVTLDTTAPGETISSTIGTNTGSTSTITSGGLTHDNTLALSGTVSDANGVSSVQIYDGATLLGPAAVNNGTWSFTTAGLLDGNHSFTAKAIDVAGNTTTTAAVTAIVDTTAPAAPSISSFSPDTGVVGDHITNVNTLTLTGMAEANSTIKVYDGSTLVGSAMASGSGAWNFTTGTLANGPHSFTATDTDAAGNTSLVSQPINPIVDTTAPAAPVFSCISPVGDGITSVNTLALTGDAEANSTIKLYDGATLLGSVTANGSGQWAYTTAALADGAHHLIATDTDAAGNTGAASFS